MDSNAPDIRATAEDFLDRINKVTAHYLADCVPDAGSEKTIHDPIWGSVVYYRWEIQLIDTPLFQRLRDIRQLGMAEYTYPAARHSRYEHSLGTVAIASRMLEKLRSRYGSRRGQGAESGGESDMTEADISEKDIYTVRLAALLHDIGHCVFSHLSESVYGSMPEFIAMREYVKENCGQDIFPKPHELLSYLIITSEAFCEFFRKYIAFPHKGNRTNCRRLLQEAANMVIGVNNFITKGERLICRSFLTSIINSDFDADKLDYTQRDSYTAGIALTYGIERFLMKLVIYRHDTRDYTDYRLAVTDDALITVEELIFNRNILYVYMYRHQKILATEDVMRDCIYGLVAAGLVKHPCDFLYLSDRDINQLGDDESVPYPEDAPHKTFSTIIGKISDRWLPKRCLVIDGGDLTSDTGDLDDEADRVMNEIRRLDPGEAKERLKSFGENYGRLLSGVSSTGMIKKLTAGLETGTGEPYMQLRREWLEYIKEKYKEKGLPSDGIDPLDLHIVFPGLSESRLSLLVVGKNGEGYKRDNFQYINNWCDAFAADKWKGYFFVSSTVDRRIAGEAARELICRRLGWLFSIDIGEIIC